MRSLARICRGLFICVWLFTTALSFAKSSSGTPVVALSPSSLNFGSVSVGQTSAVQFVTIKNSGSASLIFTSRFSITGAFAFAGQGNCAYKVVPGASCTISIKFSPTTAGVLTGTVTVHDNAGTSQVIALRGSGILKIASALSISPNTAALQTSQSEQFTAALNGIVDPAVTWSVDGVAGGNATWGTISSNGLYQAPASVPSSRVVTVTATTADGTSNSVPVTLSGVSGPISVSITPTSASLSGSETQQFTSAVSGTTNTSVTWLVNGHAGGNASSGTITSDGLYTAPGCGTAATATITAVSVYNTSVSASATVTIGAGSASNQLYVSPDGDDSNDGSACRPFATIQHAANVVNPGSTVIVENGTYSNAGANNVGSSLVNITRGGTASAPVTFMAQNPGGAVLDGRGNGTGMCPANCTAEAFTVGANYVNIKGFEIYGFSDDAISNYRGGQYLDISGNNIHDIGRYCTTTGIGRDGVYLYHNNVTFENNYLHDIGRYAPGVNGCSNPVYYQQNDHGVYISGGASNIVIRNNVFWRVEEGYSVQIWGSSGTFSNISILGNTFFYGDSCSSCAGRYGYSGIIIVDAPGGLSGLHIENNIFYEPYQNGVRFVQSSYPNSSLVKNITYLGTIANSVPSGVSSSANLDNTNPMVVSPGNAQYDSTAPDAQLQPSSPAIGNGASVSGLTLDITGAARPSPPAIGAYE